jgi:two-component system, NtrC family, nitrogen regulation sensor histidine kinase NtrY
MPPLKERFRRHRKDTRFVVGGLAALLAALVAVFYLIQRGRDVPESLLNNQLLLFVLWYANIVLILTILFVLLRNLLKLLVERRHRILGSKFKIKLVATYIGLSLIPVLLLFAYATELLQGTVDRWLDTPVAEVLEQSYQVVEGFYARIEERTLVDARLAMDAIGDLDVRDPAARPELGRRLQALLSELSLDYLAVYDGTEFVHGVVDPGSGITDLPEPGQRNLEEAAAGEPLVRRLEPRGTGGRLILAAAVRPPAPAPPGTPAAEDETAAEGETPAEAAPEAAPDAPALATVVLAGTLLDPQVVALADDLVQGHLRHRQLVVQKEPVKASHLLLFLLATLLILLASSWVGLYFARRVTVPIQALVEGTERIGEGDLDHRVDVEADDELGALVGSFNRMTGELKRNREVIERSNRELKEANARLAEERALITAVVDNVAAGVIAFDGDGRILTCNEAALRMLRQRRQDVVGQLAAEAWDDPERGKLTDLLESVAHRGLGVRGGAVVRELQLVLGGEWKSFEVKVTPMPPAGRAADEPSGRVMVLEDLSELIRAQQLAAWNDAARRIAHEIKNPLTPIRLAAERILQKHRRGDPDLGEALETGVDVLLREVGAMQAMVDEFSRFARMPRPHPARMDLGRLVAETAPLYQELKPGVGVATRVAPGVEELMADPEQLKRVLVNLIENALEATEAPGTVTVSAAADDGHAELSVADTGRGIPDADKDKLFLPYFSTKGRGTGLGLAIVHRIVSDHRGTIRVEDNLPQGTVFTVELPLR